jgi:hypothetical protein
MVNFESPRPSFLRRRPVGDFFGKQNPGRERSTACTRTTVTTGSARGTEGQWWIGGYGWVQTRKVRTQWCHVYILYIP